VIVCPAFRPRSDDRGSVVAHMRKFRCYFVDESGVISSWRSLEREAQEVAHQHALGLLLGYAPAMIVEVWEDTNLTFRYSRLETPQTPSELRRLCDLALASAEQEIDKTIKRAVAWGAAQLASQAEDIERRALAQCQSDPQNLAKT
jgi:hypothetical protein